MSWSVLTTSMAVCARRSQSSRRNGSWHPPWFSYPGGKSAQVNGGQRRRCSKSVQSLTEPPVAIASLCGRGRRAGTSLGRRRVGGTRLRSRHKPASRLRRTGQRGVTSTGPSPRGAHLGARAQRSTGGTRRHCHASGHRIGSGVLPLQPLQDVRAAVHDLPGSELEGSRPAPLVPPPSKRCNWCVQELGGLRCGQKRVGFHRTIPLRHQSFMLVIPNGRRRVQLAQAVGACNVCARGE